MIKDEIVDDGHIDLVEQRLHVHAPFLFGNVPLQTCQQRAFVDASRHRRVDRRHGCSQVLERTLRHPPQYGAIRRKPQPALPLHRQPGSWRGWIDHWECSPFNAGQVGDEVRPLGETKGALRQSLPVAAYISGVNGMKRQLQTIASGSGTERFPPSDAPGVRLRAEKMSCTSPSFPSPRMIRPLMSISYQACEI